MYYRGIAFFDMDGVLADCSARLPYERVKDYDNFYDPAKVAQDTVNLKGRYFAKSLVSQGYKIIIVTSRSDRCKMATYFWLKENAPVLNIRMRDIYMRREGDHRPSAIVKTELVEKAILDNPGIFTAGLPFNYFVDDYVANTTAVAQKFGNFIIPITFGTERLCKEADSER